MIESPAFGRASTARGGYPVDNIFVTVPFEGL
jgi:hypothetical protein